MFQAIDRLLQVDAEFAQRSPAQLHARVVEENALGLDEARLQLLRASLAMHVHAPAIEAAYEYYRERQDGERMRLEVAPSCAVHGDAVWMEWQGRKLCNADEWKSAGTGAVEEVTSAADLHPAIDHVRKNVASDASSIPNSPETAIVYADVLSPRFATFHRVLSAAADAGAITYILRWKPSPSSETTVPLYLNGYGVELMLKSTEYKVTDDQKIVQDGSGNAEADGDTQRNTVGTDVSTDTTADTLFGFDFRELAARYPSANVSNFRATLLAEMDSTAAPRIPPVQPGEMANIGERFASFITASPFPLHTMRRFVEDFPKFHRFLATRPIDQDVAAEMRANQRDRVQAGAEVLWMNGMEVDLEKFNVFAYVGGPSSLFALFSTRATRIHKRTYPDSSQFSLSK